ncbi:MAG: family 43 glycosylhydrolase [Clostridiales bacterium]|nr:family 43 glycosylhydrolase [Clostridiales bacterium]
MNLKRFLAGATSLAVSAGLLTIMPFNTGRVYADFEVVSDDFEINYDGWCDSGENTILLAVENQGNNDTRGMMVTNRSSESDGAYSQKGLYLDGGEKYNYSVFVKHDGEGIETFELALSYQDSKTGEINSKTIATEDVASGEWAELSTKYKAPKNAQDITLSITTDSISDFFFDDVTITHRRKENMNTVSAANNNVGLKDMYANYFRVGSVLNSGTVTNSTITAVMLKEFNSITHENELKPDATLVQAGSTNNDIKVSLNRAASILNFCAENNIGVRGHTLVWHSQTPEWFFKDNFQNNGAWASQSVMDQRMESYIKNMFAIIKAQYPSLNLYAYDVVNEAVSDDANRTRNFGGAREPGYNDGKSPWVQIYGDNKFIEKAFTYARKYAPASCQLYYNDYNEYWDHKRDSIAAMCTSLYNKGLLDGVGMQSHINADMNGFTGIDTYKTAINKYINIGCDVQITELDISTENGKFSLQQQATKYEAIFKAAVDVNKSSSKGKITAVCVWGPNDTNTWIGSENAPLLFDRNMQPKPAYNALASLIPQSEWGDGSNPGDKPIEPEKPDSNGYYYHDKFEGSMGEWVNRGDAEILLSGRAPYKDAEALLIKDRTGAWNGAQRALNARTFVPGNKYCFSTAAMFLEGGSSVTFCMKLQYVDANGDTQYDTISMKNTIAGEWVHLYNPEYKIPADATNMYVYVETEDDTMNFYIDEAIGAIAGTVITGPAEINLMIGDLNFDGSINSLDLAIAKRGIISGFASNSVKLAADVDGSGVVDIDDVKYLKQYILGIITEFPDNAPEMPTADIQKMESMFSSVNLAPGYKSPENNNPLYTQRFGADPGVLVYNDRVYVYTTNDVLQYDNNGKLIDNNYSDVNKINCISSADMVNWTDHGPIPVAGPSGASTWASQSWAPTAAHKKINGKDKFFLYYCNNASGIGVLSSDSPTGPWVDPIGKPLVSRQTPNANVTWLFDPAILVDDDGTGYLYFGGGVPEGQDANPKTARVVRLGDDMISLSGTPQVIDAPYMFEDSGINKIGDTYYYSYCTNWNTGGNNLGIGNGQLAYMTSNSPMGPFTYRGIMFVNQGTFFGLHGNNHHTIAEFKGQLYLFYHARAVEAAAGLTGNYRSPQIDKVTIKPDGTFESVIGTMKGVSQVQTLNPYQTVQAETIYRQGGNDVLGLGDTIVKTKKGSWMGVRGAAFTNGTKSITVRVKSSTNAGIKICTGSEDGTVVGYVDVPATGGSFVDITSGISDISGTKDVYFIFSGDMEIDSWSFNS